MLLSLPKNNFVKNSIAVISLLGYISIFYPSNLCAENADKEYALLSIGCFIPYINHFYVQPEHESKKPGAGFLGIAAQVEYKYAYNRFLSLSVTSAIDFMAPVPAPVTYLGGHEFLSSQSIVLQHQHVVNDHCFGYGIQFSRYTWHYQNYKDYGTITVEKFPNKSTESTNLGVAMSYRYMLNDNFYIGALYLPTFFRFKSKDLLQYQHTLSITCGFRVDVF